MKFALVDNQKKEAEKGLRGLCPICQQPVIAKCGKYKINHWAHKSIAHCDNWWENLCKSNYSKLSFTEKYLENIESVPQITMKQKVLPLSESSHAPVQINI